jgi:hypothetical protein
MNTHFHKIVVEVKVEEGVEKNQTTQAEMKSRKYVRFGDMPRTHYHR